MSEALINWFMVTLGGKVGKEFIPVSYTHLDVYKRQTQARGRVDKFNKKYGIK